MIFAFTDIIFDIDHFLFVFKQVQEMPFTLHSPAIHLTSSAAI